jgi:hypothetical protein
MPTIAGGNHGDRNEAGPGRKLGLLQKEKPFAHKQAQRETAWR